MYEMREADMKFHIRFYNNQVYLLPGVLLEEFDRQSRILNESHHRYKKAGPRPERKEFRADFERLARAFDSWSSYILHYGSTIEGQNIKVDGKLVDK